MAVRWSDKEPHKRTLLDLLKQRKEENIGNPFYEYPHPHIPVWVTGDLKRILVIHMSDSHLYRVLPKLETVYRGPDTFERKRAEDWKNIMYRELERRQKWNKQQENEQ